MNDWKKALSESMTACLAEGRSTIAQMYERAAAAHPNLRDSARDMELREYSYRYLKRCMHDPHDSEAQMLLPGLQLPAAIPVRHELTDEVEYVRSDCATWAELIAAREEKVRNVSAAEKKLQDFDDQLDRLRPYMETTGITVAEAIVAMRRVEK